MTFSEQEASFENRISNQLHVFSELSEILTLRLLEIEQRLAHLESNAMSQDNLNQEDTDELLVKSQERAVHLKSLLSFPYDDNDSGGSGFDTSSELKEKIHPDSEVLGNHQPIDLINQVPDTELDDQNQSLNQSSNSVEELLDTQYVDDPQTTLLSA